MMNVDPNIPIHHLRMMVYQWLVNVDPNHHHPNGSKWIHLWSRVSAAKWLDHSWPNGCSGPQSAPLLVSVAFDLAGGLALLCPVWAPKDSWASWVIQNLKSHVWIPWIRMVDWFKRSLKPRAKKTWFNESLPRQTTAVLDDPDSVQTMASMVSGFQQPRKALLKSKFLGHAAKEPCSCTGSDWVQPESSIMYIKPPQIEQ